MEDHLLRRMERKPEILVAWSCRAVLTHLIKSRDWNVLNTESVLNAAIPPPVQAQLEQCLYEIVPEIVSLHSTWGDNERNNGYPIRAYHFCTSSCFREFP